MIETKEQTSEGIQESLALGFSPKAILEMLEEDENANPDAVNELRAMI